MKRLWISLAVAVIIFVAVLSIWSSDPATSPTELSDKKYNDVLNSGENFVVEELTDGKGIKYRYTIIDRLGYIIEQALCTEEPKVVQKTENLLGVRFTNDDSRFYRYYNLSTNEISQSFKNAFWDNGTLVAYFEHKDGLKFTVCPIFGEGYTCSVSAPTSFWQVVIAQAVPNGDNTALIVNYVSGEDKSAYPTVYQVSIPLSVMVEQYLNE